MVHLASPSHLPISMPGPLQECSRNIHPGKAKDRDHNVDDRKLSRRILTLIRILFPDHR
jgi:hypothetical protein